MDKPVSFMYAQWIYTFIEHINNAHIIDVDVKCAEKEWFWIIVYYKSYRINRQYDKQKLPWSLLDNIIV
jgi:hypothetical protein